MTAFLRVSARALHLLCITSSMLLLAYVLNSRVEAALLQGRGPVRYVSAVARPAAALDSKRLTGQPAPDGPVLQRFNCDRYSLPGQPASHWEELVCEREAPCPSASSYVVQQLSPQRFKVSLRRDNQDEPPARFDPYCLTQEVRIVPGFRHGQSHGFTLFSIKSESLHYRLGLRSGDVVRQLNGKDLDSPEKMLELYTQFERASRIALTVERDKKTLRYTYLIQR